MKDKKYIIISSSIIVFLLVLILIVSLLKPKTVNKLNDPNIFFTLQEILNDEVQNDYYMDNSYTIENVYVKEIDLVSVYFINGFYIGRNEDATYRDNDNYIIRTKGILYDINRINTSNIEEYANNYNEENITINSSNIIPTITYSEKNKLIYYITTFKSLLDLDYQKAYEYLTDNQKDKYSNINNFYNQKEDITLNISTNINYFDKKESKKVTTYTINTSSNKTITIYEYGLMNYKIEY